jgi:hypothetical protein
MEKVFSWEENFRSLRIEPKTAPTPRRGSGAGTWVKELLIDEILPVLGFISHESVTLIEV